MPTLLAAAMLIAVLLGVDYYMDIKQDDGEARKLVSREMRIVEQSIMWELWDVELLVNELAMMVNHKIDEPDTMAGLTQKIMQESDFIIAAAIGFVPDFYKEKGRWFEPSCMRHNGKLVQGQDGGPEHDYFQMEWYRKCMENPTANQQWTAPYIDPSQNNANIMSLTRPVYLDNGNVAGVVCIDVSLQSLKRLLQSAKPYPGSICQLLDSQGHLLVSSDDVVFDDKDYFVSENLISKRSLMVRLACPKAEIYGPTTIKNIMTFGIMLIGMLLLAYIVQRSIRNIVSLNNANQQRQAVDNEMRIAHNIQMSMLRNDFPPELCAVLKPMKEVGGDLYDFYQKDDALFFIIGDVSGKGLPAAMMMAATVNLFRMTARYFNTPAEIVEEINNVISVHNPSLIFVTAFVGKLDMRHGLLTYCSAGHNPPILNGRFLDTDPDIPIGYDAGYSFRQYGALFPEGSRIVLYTDGITEARNSNREFLGTERLLSIAGNCQMEGIGDMTKRIISDTYTFSGHAEQNDDITLMCIANDVPGQSPSLVITNDTEELQRVKPLVREYCECVGCDRRLTRKIVLAIEEAVANVINYAYPKGELGDIEIDILAVSPANDHMQGDITVIISDSGKPFNPLEQQDVDVSQAIDDRQVGGLGIYLYQKLMDTVLYNRTDDGRNVLTLTKNISKVKSEE